MICKCWFWIICRDAILIITVYNFHHLHKNEIYYMSNTIWLRENHKEMDIFSTFSDADNEASPIGMKTMPRKINAVTTWMQKMTSIIKKPFLKHRFKGTLWEQVMLTILWMHTHCGVKIGLQAGSSCWVNLESIAQKYASKFG